MVETTVLLLCAGRQEVTEIRGNYPMVEQFERVVLSQNATKLALPPYVTTMYVMDSDEARAAAETEWEKMLAE